MSDKNNSKRWQRHTLVPTQRIPREKMFDLTCPLAAAPDRIKTPASTAVTERIPVIAA